MTAVRFSMLSMLSMLLGVASTGCNDLDPPPPLPFKVYVKVESDPGRPLPGAAIIRASKTLATTGDDGRALLTLTGAEGESTDIAIKCPDAFQSPQKPTNIRLTRFADPQRIPEYSVSCPPTRRRVVVAVKADNGPNLPVTYLNRVIARTDASGAAHALLDVAPGSQLQIGLDTSENPRMKPSSPSKPFTIGQNDEILLFEQKFEVERVRVHIPRVAMPKAIN